MSQSRKDKIDKKSLPSKKYLLYLYHQLEKRAREDAADIKVLHEKCYYFVSRKNPSAQNSGYKIHINIRSSGDVPQTWDAILPLMMKDDSLFTNIKVIIPRDIRNAYEKNIEKIQKLSGYVYQLDENTGVINQYQVQDVENLKVAQKYVAEADFNRMSKSAQITIYIDKEAKVEEYQELCKKIESALKEKKIDPSERPDSDFQVKNSIFLSVRYDKDKSGQGYVGYLKADKKEYKDHDFIKALADPEDLKIINKNKYANKPEEKAKPTGQKFDFIDLLRKKINKNKSWFLKKPKEEMQELNKALSNGKDEDRQSIIEKLEKIGEKYKNKGDLYWSLSRLRSHPDEALRAVCGGLSQYEHPAEKPKPSFSARK